MTFYCLTEPDYESSIWHSHIANGLLEEKRAKRYDVCFLNGTEALLSLSPAEDDVALVIASGEAWTKEALSLCGARFDRRIVLLGNVAREAFYGRFSIVSSDVTRDVTALYKYLLACGKQSIAMYGINPHSASDRFRKSAFLAAGGKAADIFYNEGSLADCFAAFARRKDGFDGILCANDLCAVSLIRHLQEASLPLPFIASCGETLLARHFSPTVTNLQTRYGDFGRAGIHLARLLVKNPAVGSADVLLESEIVPGESTALFPVPIQDEPRCEHVRIHDGFYEDEEVGEMLSLEALLHALDGTDRAILSRLCSGESYAQIADAIFLSVNGIKYKLSRLCTLCGLESKDELLSLLAKYGLIDALQAKT